MLRSFYLKRWVAVSATGLLFGSLAVGCAAASNEDGSQSEQSGLAAEQAPEVESKFERRTSDFIRSLARAAALDAAQRSEISSILALLDPEGSEAGGGGEAMEPRAAFHLRLSEQVKLGAVDAAEFEDETAAVSAKARAHAARAERALDLLHGTLSRDQRHSLVVALRTRADQHSARKAERSGDKSSCGQRSLSRGLELSAEQELELKAAYDRISGEAEGERRERRAARKAKAESALWDFVEDDFEASSLNLGDEFEQGAKDHLERELQRTEALLEVVTPEQQVSLAAKLERKAERGSWRGKFTKLRLGVSKSLKQADAQ